MPGLQELQEGVLVLVLDQASDTSGLRLGAASRGARKAVQQCRDMGSEGPWRHPPGTWEPSGLWRHLGLGDLQRLPSVTLCCQIEFQNVEEVVAFTKAAMEMAAQTINGHVSFSIFTFRRLERAKLFHRTPWDFFSRAQAKPSAHVCFNGRQYECRLHASPGWDNFDEEGSSISLHVDPVEDVVDVPQSPSILWGSLSKEWALDTCDTRLTAESPLAASVKAGRPLPMMLGIESLCSSYYT
ncbi:unnamed protein product [Symbiodinium sp. CCMP2592]|nr:unnamed protein product [Symbiodinium sp. CCMP2592]